MDEDGWRVFLPYDKAEFIQNGRVYLTSEKSVNLVKCIFRIK